MGKPSDRLTIGQPAAAFIQSAHGAHYQKYLAKLAVPKASTFDQETVTAGTILGESIDVIVLYPYETSTRLLDTGQLVVGHLLPTRDEETGKPLMLAAIVEPCCGPYVLLAHCCDINTPLYWVTQAEYNSASPCFGVRFGLHEDEYYRFTDSVDEIPDLPHFPGTVTCDVCAFINSSHCDHECYTELDEMDVYIPVQVTKARYEYDDAGPEPPHCDQIETLTSPCPDAFYTYVKFAATDVAALFQNQKTGARCGDPLAWFDSDLGEFAVSGHKCEEGVLTNVRIVHGLGELRACAIRRDCPVEFIECDVDFDEFTWSWESPDPFEDDEEICDFCGLI